MPSRTLMGDLLARRLSGCPVLFMADMILLRVQEALLEAAVLGTAARSTACLWRGRGGGRRVFTDHKHWDGRAVIGGGVAEMLALGRVAHRRVDARVHGQLALGRRRHRQHARLVE